MELGKWTLLCTIDVLKGFLAINHVDVFNRHFDSSRKTKDGYGYFHSNTTEQRRCLGREKWHL